MLPKLIANNEIAINDSIFFKKTNTTQPKPVGWRGRTKRQRKYIFWSARKTISKVIHNRSWINHYHLRLIDHLLKIKISAGLHALKTTVCNRLCCMSYKYPIQGTPWHSMGNGRIDGSNTSKSNLWHASSKGKTTHINLVKSHVFSGSQQEIALNLL